MRAFEYEHVVTFEDTNVVGNVYFARYISWQGRCRELFLREHAPTLAEELARDLRLVTTRVACDFFAELRPFDTVVVRMRLRSASQTRIAMTFEYLKRTPEGDEVVARGEQETACLRSLHGGVEPAPVPTALREALEDYAPAHVCEGGGL